MRCRSSTTLTAREWTSCKITPDVSLEVGTYTLVGMLANSATAIAARAIISGQVWRPGVPALAGDERVVKNCDPLYLSGVQRYAMGSFTHLTIPEIQFLANAADSGTDAQRVYLYLVKTA